MSRRRGIALLAAAAGTAFLVRRTLRPRCSFAGQRVVITGGARGLGLEMARLLVAEGAWVAICSRSLPEVEAAIEELRGPVGRIYGEVCDVTDETQITSFLQRITSLWGRVDVLINNAGIIQAGPVECMTLEDYTSSMATHFWGPLYAIRAVLPQMKARRAGRIVNISSIGGKISVPHMAPYCASKFALVGLSEGLRAELSKDGISVTTVCPGLMRTGSPRNADFKGRHREEYTWFSIGASLPVLATDSRIAARRIVEACRSGAREIYVSRPAFCAIRGHGAFTNLSLRVLECVNRLLPSAKGGSSHSRKGWQSYSRWSPSWITVLNERAARRNHETLDRTSRHDPARA